eukprot:6284285-Amphidinium_carterae.1
MSMHVMIFGGTSLPDLVIWWCRFFTQIALLILSWASSSLSRTTRGNLKPGCGRTSKSAPFAKASDSQKLLPSPRSQVEI